MRNIFLWVDLEMTGLDPQKDVVLEIASMVTDAQLNIMAEGPSIVIHHTHDVLNHMDNKVRAMHTQSGLLDRVISSNISLGIAEQQIYEFAAAHTQKGTRALLAGNSIWNDRAFLQRYMPRVLTLLHYRVIDVSTVKELVLNWYPNAVEFKKQKRHRALDDIHESISELKHYKSQYFV